MNLNRAATKYLILNRPTLNRNVYHCYCQFHHRYFKTWLNGYDILGINPRHSSCLFTLRQVKRAKHYLTEHVSKSQRYHIISLTKARVIAGKQIQNDMQ